MTNRLLKYFKKMRGVTKSPSRVSIVEIVWSWIGSFVGITAVAGIHYNMLENSDLVMIIGSFGASAVLIYGAIESPLAQPRNFVGGHVISALIGVLMYQLFKDHIWLAGAASVSVAIAAMHITKTLHPPGGATALIAVIGSNKIHALGYLYVIMPTMFGAVVMLVIALLVNNMSKNRRYPTFWL